MKTIAELEAAYNDAVTKHREAQDAMFAARAALEQAHLDASGLEGHLVEYDYKKWRGPAAIKQFIVTRCMNGRASGPFVKKDGTISQLKEHGRLVEDLRDLGPYKAPE